MYIKHADDVVAKSVDMDGAEGVTCRVLIGREQGAACFAMRDFTVVPGGYTPLHQHNYEHEVLVLSGKGLVRGGDTYRSIDTGDVVFLAANELHQFQNVGDQPLRFICLVPVDFDCGDGMCMPTPGT